MIELIYIYRIENQLYHTDCQGLTTQHRLSAVRMAPRVPSLLRSHQNVNE